MDPSKRPRRLFFIGTFLAIILIGSSAQAQNKAYQQIYEFGRQRTDGWEPEGTLAVAKNGDLYGVTEAGGTSVWGTVYKLTAPKNRGGKWMRTTLYDFPATTQEFPTSLIIGKDGALYGAGQGPNVRGFIFRLTPSPSGHAPWTYEVLYTLNSKAPASVIETNMVFDAAGNLYGATESGGDFNCFHGYGCGTVFELKRPAKSGGKWRFSVLYSFTGAPDGAEPFAGATFDQNGNLYGTTIGGGTNDWGAVYRLSPPTEKGRPWTETVVYSFDEGNNDIVSPTSPLTFDSSGNMYGATEFGGDLNCQGGFGCGVVYELSPTQQQTWVYTTLYAFQGGNDGIDPSGYMVFDQEGNLYGVTQIGGSGADGTAYRLSPPTQGGAWTETVLHTFKGVNGNDGAVPRAGLTWGKWNDLYGGATEGGLCGGLGCGTAFALQP